MRSLSSRSIQAITVQQTGEILLPLIDMDHASFPDGYFVANSEPVTSGGKLYTPVAFMVTMPNDEADGIPVVKLTIDNVDRGLINEIRGATGEIGIKLRWILFSEPDVVLIEYPRMELRSVEYDVHQISGTVKVESVLEQNYSKLNMGPAVTPGIF